MVRRAVCLGVLRRDWSGSQESNLMGGQQPPVSSILFQPKNPS